MKAFGTLVTREREENYIEMSRKMFLANEKCIVDRRVEKQARVASPDGESHKTFHIKRFMCVLPAN